MDCNRRQFLKIGAQAAVGCFFPTLAFGATNRSPAPGRVLHFYNTHTHETLDVCYYSHGYYHPEALDKINYILRDHYTGEIKPIHRDLLDLLYALTDKLGNGTQYHVISGYRSPQTNAMLCRRSKGVARHSLHMKGEAIDIRVPGCQTRSLRNICIKMKAGGVGYYRKSDFVHVDIGRVRYW